MTQVGQRAEVRSIQYLRGLAALLVVFHHAHEQFPGFERMLPTTLGAGGVDLFFVISGFIMIYTTHGRELTAAQFMADRVKRIVPLYWIMTVFTAGLLIVAPTLVRSSVFTLPTFLQSLVFWPHANPAKDGFSPMLKLGWTLNNEMFFYLVFAAFIRLREGARIGAIVACFAVLIAINLATYPNGPAPLQVWGRPLVLEFAYGCALAFVFLRGKLDGWSLPMAGAVLLTGIVAFVGLADLDPSYRFLIRGLPAVVIIAGALAIERAGRLPRARPLHVIGNATYSIYLTHLYAVILFRVVWTKLHLPTDKPAWCALFILLCLAVGLSSGLFSYLFIELPVGRLLRRGVKPRRVATPAVTAAPAQAE